MRALLRRRNESGQAAVLIAVLMAVLIVIVAATTNMGKLVTEKMALQNAVDLAVYSGAATQAGHLNRMRKINDDAWKALYEKRQKFEPSQAPGIPEFHAPQYDGPACYAAISLPMGMSAVQAEQDVSDLERQMADYKRDIKEINKAGVQDSIEAARAAADKNYPGTKDKLTPLHDASDGGMMKISEGKVEISYKGWCQPPIGPPLPAIFVTQHRVQSWEFKDDTGQVMFAASIKAAPASPFMEVGKNYFTPQNCDYGGALKGGRCEMSVYAVAQPYHGKLGSILNGKGGAFFEKDPNLWNIMDNIQPSPVIDMSVMLLPHRVKGGTFLDYQVRFVGVFEPNMKLIGDGQPIQQKVDSVSGGLGKYMEH